MKKRSFLAGSLALVLCVSDVAAATKDICVFGARSINDSGSDTRTTLEQLKDDYSPFRNTDSLTEYFHKEQADPVKVDVTEAQAWLIDHGIIVRDKEVTVSNISAASVPSVSISLNDLNAAMFENVTRSDAIMYLYKSVFGPVYGRVIGVETANVRNENGQDQTMKELFNKHKSQTYDPENIGNVTSNEAYTWNYTPQGDEYDSIFGDTNIFISDVDMDLRNGGTGNSQTGTAGDSVYGNGGDVNNEFNWETNYKQIYYKLGADTWFYRTSDAIEPYIQAALSKGVLGREKVLRSSSFSSAFDRYAGSKTFAPWSGSAYPYILNRNKTGMFRPNNAEASSVASTLGVNFTINFTGNDLSIKRNNFLMGTSGYFVREDISRLEVYRLLYDFVYANEKKLSELETDIVNYKYGMQLNGLASEEDIQVLKYLIAKGILSFDDTADFANLAGNIVWEDFLPILYRVANHDARLNFSLVQLTDSDQQWKAKGFYPQSVAVVGGEFASDLSLEYTQEYFKTAENEVVSAENVKRASSIQYSGLGPMSASNVKFAEPVIAYATSRQGSWGYRTYLTFNFDAYGMLVSGDPKSNYYLPKLLEGYLDKLSVDTKAHKQASYAKEYSEAVGRSAISWIGTEANYKFIILHDLLLNVHVIALLQANPTVAKACQDQIQVFLNRAKTSSQKDLDISIGNGLMSYLNKAINGTCGISAIRYTVNGKQIKAASLVAVNGAPASDILKAIQQLSVIQFVSSKVDTGAIKITFEHPYVYDSGMTTDDSLKRLNQQMVCFQIPQTNSKLAASSPEEILKALEQSLGTTMVDLGGASRGIETYTDKTGKDAFVSWSSIADYNATATEANKIPIQQISESLLYNSETDTYAYFSSEKESKIALVGTTIVTGDPDLGVAFKSGNGESTTSYYHMNAIRLLMDAQQETSVISGTHALTTVDKNIKNSLTKVPLLYESGASNLGSVIGFRALMSANDKLTSAAVAHDSVYLKGVTSGNYRYGDFISLSQANRVMNVISKRIQWTTKAGVTATGYAVVFFNPVPVDSLGTATVTSKTSLQDLLNMPASAPSDPVAKKNWANNKRAANAYANWVYGTSGKTYIQTGYVQPDAYLYVINQDGVGSPPDSTFNGLDETNPVKVISLGRYFNGCVTAIGGAVTNTATWRSKNSASYFLSTDYRVIVAGDRVYVNDGAFSAIQLTKDKRYQVVNQTAVGVGFTYGVELSSKNAKLSNGIATPKMVVSETKTDGTVVCQVGPFYGIPLNDGSACLADRSKVSAITMLSSAGISANSKSNVLLAGFNEMFRGYSDIKYEGLVDQPSQASENSNSLRLVYDGSGVSAYFPGETKVTGKAVAITTDLAKGVTIDDYTGVLETKFNRTWHVSGAKAANVAAYIKISFPAYKFSVVNGVLTQKNADASDFLSAACFSNLNDLIINAMIDKSNGAIPVNNIPAGSLLELGNGWYAASGSSSKSKTFYGYAYVNNISGVHVPTEQDAAKAFAGQLILGGNQYINVSQYFEMFKVLNGITTEQKASLKLVQDSTLSLDNTTKICVDSSGISTTISKSHDAGASSSVGKLYAPVALKFQQDQLYAYRVGSQSTSVPMYRLCSMAENSVSGPFEELPFFTNSILDAALFDRTLDVKVSNFTRYERAGTLTDQFKADFKRAMEGDLVTLARMVTFLILIWLVVASWACYACKFANVMPFIQNLRNPGRGGSQKGFDLFKIMTLGTISVDDDLHLGKFIQYQLILAALMLVVKYTGNLVI